MEVSLRDVAKRAGVSPATASRALNGHPQVREETRRRVLEAARELGYELDKARREPAETDRHLLGLLVPNVITPFYCELLRCVQEVVFARQCDLVLYVSQGHAPQAVIERIASARHLAGVIVVTPRHSEDEGLRKLGAELAVVVLDHRAEGSGFPHVTVDNLRAAHRATSYLVKQGHRRIGFISGPLSVQSAMDRLRGYRLALEEAGIGFDPSLVKQGDFEQPTGYDIVSRWIHSERALPDALFCANDLMAAGALQALKEAGVSVPGDLALMGFDDLPIASVTSPPLTTVAQPIHAMCEAAVRQLMRLVQGEEPDVHRVVLDAELVIRRSA